MEMEDFHDFRNTVISVSVFRFGVEQPHMMGQCLRHLSTDPRATSLGCVELGILAFSRGLKLSGS